MSTITINVELVRKEILLLNVNKSCGPDEIGPLLLIKLIDVVADLLALQMNTSLNHGVLPLDWKKEPGISRKITDQ